jgi:hypothetical protein
MKVYVNSKDRTTREIVEAELISEAATTVHVKLPDGNIIKRKKGRDVVK